MHRLCPRLPPPPPPPPPTPPPPPPPTHQNPTHPTPTHSHFDTHFNFNYLLTHTHSLAYLFPSSLHLSTHAAPVVFVDYYRANLMSDPTNPESQFYYVFLREQLHTDIDSRVSFDVRGLWNFVHYISILNFSLLHLTDYIQSSC